MPVIPTVGWTSVERLFEILRNGEQMDVLFGSPGWATAIVGVVTRFDDRLDWMMYLQDKDRFEDWGAEPPTLFARKPDLPDEGETHPAAETLPVDHVREAFKAGWRTNAVKASEQSPAAYLDGCEAVDWQAYCEQGIDKWLAGLESPSQDTDEAEDEVSVAARLERIMRIGRQILWTDYGVPAVANKQTRNALENLADILFFEAVSARMRTGDAADLRPPRRPSIFEILRAERDDADRRAGAAARENASLQEERRKRLHWMSDRKKEIGLSDVDSFDDAWRHLVALASPVGCELAEALERMEKLLEAAGKARTALAGFTSADDAAFALDVAIGDLADWKRRAALATQGSSAALAGDARKASQPLEPS